MEPPTKEEVVEVVAEVPAEGEAPVEGEKPAEGEVAKEAESNSDQSA